MSPKVCKDCWWPRLPCVESCPSCSGWLTETDRRTDVYPTVGSVYAFEDPRLAAKARDVIPEECKWALKDAGFGKAKLLAGLGKEPGLP